MKPLFTVLIALLGWSTAAAGTAGNVQVNATILTSCTSRGTSLNFGSRIDPLVTGGAVDANAVLSVTCTNTTPYSVALSAGTNAGGSAAASRAMRSGNYVLPYELYLDPGRSKVWGEGGNAYTGIGVGDAQSLTIYGRLPSLAGVALGSYSETVTVTISY